ncbi:helix-turn-helix transcriptional regulator [Candidatus Soleaferrea massiliensis]|uniref:helix-turn-helix transcriptional regulator n=1 Tax=Candidatus Soleaferrea massiliensis TaxID=1470354 RepID=UPI000694EB32|nr:helix-turn-helix transcriptional regulator [Candidatus Soleaferrea massiliensis]
MTKEEIGAVLKKLRLNCGMTQQQVADALSRKQQVIGHWETGYAQPDADTLFTLCDLYGASIDEAFGFKKEKASAVDDESPLTEEEEKAAMKLYNAFLEAGIIQPGGGLTDRQVEFFDGLSLMINAVFGENEGAD